MINYNKYDKFLIIYIVIEMIFLLGSVLYKIYDFPRYEYNPGDIFLGLFLFFGFISLGLFSFLYWRYGLRINLLVDEPRDRGKVHRAFDLSYKDTGIDAWIRPNFKGEREAWSIVDEYEAKTGKKLIIQYYKKFRNRLLIGFLNFYVVMILYVLVSLSL